MKIIISPSKTMHVRLSNHKYSSSNKDILFRKKVDSVTNYLIKYLKSFDKEYIANKMKLKGKLLDTTINDINNYQDNPLGTALLTYSGTVFNELDIDSYRKEHFIYANDNVRILSALYGSLSAMDTIKNYRLDMTMNLFDKSLYNIWDELINEYYTDELILNLASNEYSKMIKKEMIDVDFLVGGKRVAYHSKVARGKMLDFIIKNKIQDISLIKKEEFHGYKYNKKISTAQRLVYTK